MPHPHTESTIDRGQLQTERERLRQALAGGTLEEAAEAMQAIHALLPKSMRKKTLPPRRKA
jgi:hypothetical protein